MASIWKNPNSKYLVACWTDPNGRRLKRSTGTTDKKIALRMAEKFEAESRGARTLKQARRVLTDIYAEKFGAAMSVVSVRNFFTSYIERKRPEVSTATLDYYVGHTKRFLSWLGERADADIAKIGTADLLGYRNHVAAQAGPRTVNNTIKALRTFFGAAVKGGYLAEDPAAEVDTVRDREEASRRPFTLDELRAVLKAAPPEWQSLIRCGLYLGQRLGDVATLKWSNVDLGKNEISLITLKTGRKQVLPIPAPLRQHLQRMKQPKDSSDPVHPAAAEIVKKTGRTGMLSKQFAEILRSANLRTPATPATGGARAKYPLSYHSLRHTSTTLLKDAGIPASTVMQYVGHSSAAVSQGYTHTGREALEKAASVFPEL